MAPSACDGFAGRDLSEFDVIYLFVDGIAERLHLGQPRDAVLAAWTILDNDQKALLHLASGTKEVGDLNFAAIDARDEHECGSCGRESCRSLYSLPMPSATLWAAGLECVGSGDRPGGRGAGQARPPRRIANPLGVSSSPFSARSDRP
jgi:hypothetical protein